MDVCKKRPGEKFYIDVTFTELDAGESINAGASSFNIYQDDQDVPALVESATPTIDGNTLKGRIMNGGTVGEIYTIVFKAVSDAGNIYEKSITLKIID